MRVGRGVTVLLAASIVVAACAAPARRTTVYETFQYTVAVPDDLRLKPATPDLDVIWRTTPLEFDRADEGVPALIISVATATVESTGEETALVSARRAIELASPDEVAGPTAHPFAAGPGAVFHATMDGLPFDAVYLYRDRVIVSFVLSGAAPADVLAIADSFRFRDPPGDSLSPPSQPSAAP
jgi:hypothetical protein